MPLVQSLQVTCQPTSKKVSYFFIPVVNGANLADQR